MAPNGNTWSWHLPCFNRISNESGVWRQPNAGSRASALLHTEKSRSPALSSLRFLRTGTELSLGASATLLSLQTLSPVCLRVFLRTYSQRTTRGASWTCSCQMVQRVLKLRLLQTPNCGRRTLHTMSSTTTVATMNTIALKRASSMSRRSSRPSKVCARARCLLAGFGSFTWSPSMANAGGVVASRLCASHTSPTTTIATKSSDAKFGGSSPSGAPQMMSPR